MDRKSFLKSVPLLIGAVTFTNVIGESEKIRSESDYSQSTHTENFPAQTANLNLGYSKFTRNEYLYYMRKKSEKHFPESKKYLDLIIKANYDNLEIFNILPDYHIALLNQESRFDPFARSFAGALGIGQLMRAAAKDAGLHTYSSKKFPELSKLEDALDHDFRENARIRDLAYSAFAGNNFKNAEKYKLESDKARKKLSETRTKFNSTLKKVVADYKHTADFDERLEPELAIPASAKYFMKQCKDCQEHFHGRYEHNIFRGIAAYNSGAGTVVKWYGLPMISETVDYIRRILLNVDKLMPFDEERHKLVPIDYALDKYGLPINSKSPISESEFLASSVNNKEKKENITTLQ